MAEKVHLSLLNNCIIWVQAQKLIANEFLWLSYRNKTQVFIASWNIKFLRFINAFFMYFILAKYSMIELKPQCREKNL